MSYTVHSAQCLNGFFPTLNSSSLSFNLSFFLPPTHFFCSIPPHFSSSFPFLFDGKPQKLHSHLKSTFSNDLKGIHVAVLKILVFQYRQSTHTLYMCKRQVVLIQRIHAVVFQVAVKFAFQMNFYYFVKRHPSQK